MADENLSQNQNQNGSSNSGSFHIPNEAPADQKIGDIATSGSPEGLVKINREFQEKSTLKRAHDLGLPYVNIGKTPLNPDFLKVLDIETAKKVRIIPFFKVGNKLRIAVQNPESPDTEAVIKDLEKKGLQVSVNLASEAGIDDAMKIYKTEQQYKKMDIVENVESKAIKAYDKEIRELSELAKKIEAIPAEEALNMINVGAMKTGASDIHYEPTDEETIVRFRIDGMLHQVFTIKAGTYRNIANQIKYKCAMQLNVDSIPQDGRYGFLFNGKKIDVRVSAIPTGNGESFVCRYLVPDKNHASFESMGFKGLALKKIENASNISHGMILCTGPTGSGKTTTLYAMMTKMREETNKIITLEDPVEYHLNGVVQSQINEKRGYDFASGLRSVLRQDPDIIMVGEIRDLETAETAAQASLTGHVLLSTLHTNSAIETIPRLINMGLPRYMVASSLDTIIAQRLVRVVCPKCTTKRAITKSEKAEFEKVFANLKTVHPNIQLNVPEELPEVHGCDYCSQTGYKGRVIIDEVIVIDEKTKRLILDKASSVDLIMAAREGGMITVREDGLMKVAEGLTTLEEVYRATNVAI